MNAPVHQNSSVNGDGWTRVSSFKPHLAAVLVAFVVSFCLLLAFRRDTDALPLIVAGLVIALGLIALNCKVVHQRGCEYRISTFFYSEVLGAEDVCMTVSDPGPFWTRLRIHLRRPARFGWRVSFVPASEAQASLASLGQPGRR